MDILTRRLITSLLFALALTGAVQGRTQISLADPGFRIYVSEITPSQGRLNDVTRSKRVTVRGDFGGAAPGKVTVTVNGRKAAVKKTSFSLGVDLREGLNRFHVVATDSGGNVATTT